MTADQLTPYGAMKRRMRRAKFGNVPTMVGMIRFDSKAEANRYCELRMLAQTKAIEDLRRQVTFALYGKNGSPICTYRADFTYTEGDKQVVEDVKGAVTPEFRIKEKLFRDNYPEVDFRVVKARG